MLALQQHARVGSRPRSSDISCLISHKRALDTVPVHFNARNGCCVCIREPAGGGRAPARGMREELRWCCGFAPGTILPLTAELLAITSSPVLAEGHRVALRSTGWSQSCAMGLAACERARQLCTFTSADAWHMCTCTVSRVARPAACRAQRSPVIARCAQPSVANS